MIALYILLTVFALVVLLLSLSLKVVINISENVLFRVSVLGISLYSFDSLKPEQLKKKESHSKKDTYPKEKKKSLVSVLKEYALGKNRTETVHNLLQLVKTVCEKFNKLLSHIRFNRLKMELTVASSDAAQTAVLYGSFCSVIYTIVGLLENSTNFNPKDIKVNTDFTSDKISFLLDSSFKIRIFFIFSFILSIAIKIIKNRIGDNKNG